jgi:HTH-type transcriptional regulator / antitoxin HigA
VAVNAARQAGPAKAPKGGRARPGKRKKGRPASSRPRGASASYLALAKAHPILPIRSDEELDEAITVLDDLLARERPLDDQEQGYLEALEHEIERYEAEAVPIPEVSGADMLRYLLEARAATLSEVAAATGIALSTLSQVRDKKRNLNLTHIAKLAPYFGVEPAVFLP